MQPQPPGSVPPPPGGGPLPYGQVPVPGQPSGLVPSLGAPQRLAAGVRAFALTAGLALLAAVSVWCGWEMGSKDLDRAHSLPYVLPVVAVLIAVLLAWVGTVWQLRSDGRVLEGTGVLGRAGIDLAALDGVAAARNRNRLTVTLRAPEGRLAFDAGALRKNRPQVFDVVGRAVWAGQEQGRYVIPVLAAEIWQMPVRPGAPKRGKAGTTGPTLATIGVFVVALVVGIVLGSS